MRTTAALAVLLLAVGAPLALRLRRRLGLQPAEVVAVSALSGLVSLLVSVLVLVSFDQLSTTSLVVALTILTALGALPFFGAGPVEAAVADDDEVPERTDWRSLWLLVPVAAAALVPREPARFIFETGDMGDYVNSANRVLRGAGGFGGFPPGFTSVLTGVGSLFGIDKVAFATPVIAMVGLLLVVTTARRLSGSILASCAVGFVLAANPLVQWFSVFGISETLFAAVLTGSLLLLVIARSAADSVVGSMAGLLMAPLLIIRGNALLVVVAAMAIGVLALFADRAEEGRVQVRYSAGALAGTLIAYAYLLSVSGAYMQLQLSQQVPEAILDPALDLGLVESSVGVSLLCSALAVVAVGLGELVARRWAFESGARPVYAIASALTVAAGVVVVVVGSEEGLVDSFGRIGWLPVGLGIAGAVTVAARRRANADQGVATLAVLVLVPAIVLFVDRVPENLNHSYHLYWDRYLTSEALPMLGLFAAVALAAVLRVVGDLGSRQHRHLGTALTVVVAGAVAVWGVATRWEDTELALEQRFLGNGFEVLEDVAEQVPRDAIILYEGPDGVPAGWFFRNTYRAFAYPLAKSWGYDLPNLPPGATDTDPMVTEAQARIAAGAADDVYVLVGHAPDDEPDLGFTADLEPVDEFRYEGWFISRRRDQSEEKFNLFLFDLSLYRYVEAE